ncbi:hypothetical protein P171DRAFT_444711 [Karstenula rhodostoma CBS 690.94]|uniref:Uncharacterized protein n=1 Tax=Karstenula rhodostoma CBS 690.94 TaxID=1392251 RepID=A0A9P4PGC4_9PLEO|nr:hypothetical protein P171DRAFT_444711 [Karstenula rhodostoma CBS 690.94]
MGASIQLAPSQADFPPVTLHFPLEGGTMGLPDGRQITFTPRGAQMPPTAQPVALVNEVVARVYGVTDSEMITRAAESEVPDEAMTDVDVDDADGGRATVEVGQLDAPYSVFGEEDTATEDGLIAFRSFSSVAVGGGEEMAGDEHADDETATADENISPHHHLPSTFTAPNRKAAKSNKPTKLHTTTSTPEPYPDAQYYGFNSDGEFEGFSEPESISEERSEYQPDEEDDEDERDGEIELVGRKRGKKTVGRIKTNTEGI